MTALKFLNILSNNVKTQTIYMKYELTDKQIPDQEVHGTAVAICSKIYHLLQILIRMCIICACLYVSMCACVSVHL